MQWSLFGRSARAKVGLCRWWRQRQLWNVGCCIFAWPFAREDFIEYIHLVASPLHRTDSIYSQSWRLEGTRHPNWIIRRLIGCVSYNPCVWLACVTPLLNRFARTLIQIGALFVPRVVCQTSSLTYCLVDRWFSWRYMHSEALQLQYSNRHYYMQRQTKRTSRSMWRVVSNNPLWRYLRKVLKEKAPLYLGFQINPVEDMGFYPILSAKVFFVPVCRRLWTGISVPHAEKAHCYLHCNLGKTHCLRQAAGLFGQLPVYCSVLVVRDVEVV